MSAENFFTTRNPGAMTPGFRVPAAPRNTARPGRWIPPGEQVEVHDYILRGGMLYVGTGMKDPSGAPEPSLINPLCPVQPTYGCYSTVSLGYWPNYSVIAPEARGAYLGWLASGRSHPKADIGFVFMYFYGLERRAFIDSYADTRAQGEWPVLIEEVRRLLSIYGPGHGPFTERATRFIDLLLVAKSAANLVIGQGQYANSAGGMPLELKKELGNLALAGTPLSVEKALEWADGDPALNRGAAIRRLPHSFSTLFSLLYKEAYPYGLIIPASKTKLMMQYDPASQAVAGFGGIGVYLDDVPDVTVEGGASLKIQELVTRCNEELGPYSRFVGRNLDLSYTIEGLILLPVALWPESLRSALALWREKTNTCPCVTTVTELLTSFGVAGATAKELSAILRALELAGVGFEPELASKSIKLADQIVLFQQENRGTPARANPAYAAARVTLQFAHFVARADGAEHPDVAEFINRQVQGWVHLTTAHRAHLAAYSHYLQTVPASLATIKNNAKPLEPLARSAIATFLCRVAQLGRDASPVTVKTLAKLYKVLELDDGRLHSDLHAAVAGAVVPAHKAGGSQLDTARIAALMEDTAAVSVLLANIFVEDDEPILVCQQPRPDANSEWASALGLDAPHSALVKIMHARPSWARPELQAHAMVLGLMLDGAIEQINEAAFDLLDMPFVEGEDPFEINPDLPENLTL